jgi:hypothetical protein
VYPGDPVRTQKCLAQQLRSSSLHADFPLPGNHGFVGTESPSVIETCGKVFTDGGCLELVEDAATQELSLLLFNHGECTVGPRIEYTGRLYQPSRLDPSILQAMTFPSRREDYASTRVLFAGIRDLLMLNGLDETVALAASLFIFSTWFTDCLSIAPDLVITGARVEAIFLLQLLACLARHPMPLIEITPASLSSLPLKLDPTLLIDQQLLKPRMVRLLAAANGQNAFFPKGGKVVNLHCAKAIYRGIGGDELAIDAGMFHIHVAPACTRLPVLNRKTRWEIIEKFQPRLLAYRISNWTRVRDSQFDLPEFESELRILAGVLGAPIVDAPEIQAELIPLLRAQQETIRARRWVDMECVALESLLYFCRSRKEEFLIYPGKIAHTARTILEGRGRKVELTSRRMGEILRGFGLVAKRDNKGQGILLTEDVRRRIDRLAHDYRVATVEEHAGRCKDEL